MAYQAQRHHAKARGIGWEITFEEWLDWWGEDIDRRGTSPTSLQMQRIADAGPYKVGNIKKGVPKQNSQTAAIVRRNRIGAEMAQIREEHNAALMLEESGDKLRDMLDEDEKELHTMFYFKSSAKYFDLMS
jgi:hypothetical protein